MVTTGIGYIGDAAMAERSVPGQHMSHDLARSQGTDFFAMDDLLTEAVRSIRDRVRAFADNNLIPLMNKYWEQAELGLSS